MKQSHIYKKEGRQNTMNQEFSKQEHIDFFNQENKTLTQRIDEQDAEIERLRKLCLRHDINPDETPCTSELLRGLYSKYTTFRNKDGKPAHTIVWHTDRRDPQGLSDLLHRAEQELMRGNFELSVDLVQAVSRYVQAPDVEWVEGQWPERSDIESILASVREMIEIEVESAE